MFRAQGQLGYPAPLKLRVHYMRMPCPWIPELHSVRPGCAPTTYSPSPLLLLFRLRGKASNPTRLSTDSWIHRSRAILTRAAVLCFISAPNAYLYK